MNVNNTHQQNKKMIFPFISIIIPVYNLENYIENTIDSVIKQTYQNYEIICIDDGSEDNSKKLIYDYINKYPDKIKYICQNRKGASAARNAGIARAKGEWIAFLDGDDIWIPEKLEIIVSKIRENKYIDIFSSNAIVSKTNNLFFQDPIDNTNVYFNLLLRGNSIITSTVLIKSNILKKNRFNENFLYSNDMELWLRVIGGLRYYYIHKPLIIYTIRDNSLTSRGRYLQIYNEIRIIKRELRKNNFTQKEIKSIKNRISSLFEISSYKVIVDSNSSLLQRTKITLMSILFNPFKLKKYRFFLQAFIPTKINRYISKFIHNDS